MRQEQKPAVQVNPGKNGTYQVTVSGHPNALFTDPGTRAALRKAGNPTSFTVDDPKKLTALIQNNPGFAAGMKKS